MSAAAFVDSVAERVKVFSGIEESIRFSGGPGPLVGLERGSFEEVSICNVAKEDSRGFLAKCWVCKLRVLPFCR
jgi:hypothetical protein